MFDLGLLIRAVFFGGLLCVVAQMLIDKTKMTPARILVLYVVVGVFLGAVGLYEPFSEFAGAGASVPLTGFGFNISRGVREAVDKDGIIGILSGSLTAAAAGTTAALFFGYLAALIFKGNRRG